MLCDTGPKRLAAAVAALLATAAGAADLPAHTPLRILIVSDEVNPHALTDPEGICTLLFPPFRVVAIVKCAA